MILKKLEDWKINDILSFQDKVIKDCNEYRIAWAKTAQEVELAIKWIIYPQNKDWKHRNDPEKPVLLPLIQRQNRNMMNYISWNKPSITPRQTVQMSSEELYKANLINKRDFLDNNFYRDLMDKIIFYWFRRWICYILSYYTTKGIQTKVVDPLDVYIDINADTKENMRYIVYTFTKNIEQCKNDYKLDYLWDEIKWDEIKVDIEKTKNDYKKNIIKEPSDSNTILLREGWYLDYLDGKQVVVKILTTKNTILKKEISTQDFLWLDFYAPILDINNLFPYSRFSAMLSWERKANDLMNRFAHITEKWRQLFLQENARVTKGSNKMLNSLWIDVIQIWWVSDIPIPAEVMRISQADMSFLNKTIAQVEETGWIRQDAMGSTSLGSDASWTAIAEQKAGSYANTGVAVNELNKFMDRLWETYFNLYKQSWPKSIKFFDASKNVFINIETDKLLKPNFHIEPKSSFDNIVEKIDGIEMLKQISSTNPWIKISPDIWWEIYWQKNDLAKRLLLDMEKEKDPDMEMAKICIKLLMNWKKPAVSPTDNHIVHMASLQKVLAESWKELPTVVRNNFITKYNTHKAFNWWDIPEKR